MTIQCAILGTGMSCRVFHAPFILALDQFNLHSIFERRSTPTHSEARELYGPKVNVVNTFEAILNNPEIELVFVSTINDTHYQYTKDCLNAGKHVSYN